MFGRIHERTGPGFDRHIHQPLGVGNLFLQALGVDRSLLFQRQQSDIDSYKVWAISSCRSRLISFRLSSCAERIWWVKCCKYFCSASDSFKSFLKCSPFS